VSEVVYEREKIDGPSPSDDGCFAVWSKGPVRKTKSVLRASVVTQ
jgi:hypothetical protein